jgi:hypothetical protein
VVGQCLAIPILMKNNSLDYAAATAIRIVGLVVVAAASWLSASAQPEPGRFGRVSAADFELAPAQPDPDAGAIILFDYGSSSFDTQGNLIFERHRRIRILAESGFDWGTFAITYYAGRPRQSVPDLRAQSYTLGPDGRVVTHRLDRGSRFEEDIDGEHKRIRFTLPALAPGTIVEYRYTVRSPSALYAPNWQFQTSEPTLWSEYRFNIPGRLEFVVVSNIPEFDIYESNPAFTLGGRVMQHRWVMRDLPALREEPFMPAIVDHLAHLRFQLAGIRHSDTYSQRFLSTWPELAQAYREAVFEHLRRPGREVADAAREATAGNTDEFGKMVAIYDYVRQSIRFNGRMGYVPDSEPRQVLRSRSGSSSEIAFLLGAMLRAEGLSADPVLIRTRSRGKASDIYPLLDLFNDVVVHVQIENKSYLLDATDPNRPYNILDPQTLNERGWLVSDRAQRWIPVAAAGLYAHLTEVDATLDAAGSLVGRVTSRSDGYAAVEARDLLDEVARPAELLHEMLFAATSDVELSDVVVESDPSGQVLAQASFQLGAYAQAAGDLLFFSPIVVGRYESNPFRLLERSFPVEYVYPRTVSYELRLELPPGYQLLEQPASRQLRHPKGGITYRRIVTPENGRIVLQTVLSVTRTVFPPEEYADLREFYDQMIASEAEQIVLTRAPSAVPHTLTIDEDER